MLKKTIYLIITLVMIIGCMPKTVILDTNEKSSDSINKINTVNSQKDTAEVDDLKNAIAELDMIEE